MCSVEVLPRSKFDLFALLAVACLFRRTDAVVFSASPGGATPTFAGGAFLVEGSPRCFSSQSDAAPALRRKKRKPLLAVV